MIAALIKRRKGYVKENQADYNVEIRELGN